MAEEPNNMGSGGGGDKLYKGVRKRKWGKWVSEVRLPNSRERIWLGSYDSPVKAARAFDAALYCLRGCRANFNFPDTPLNLEDINIVDRSFTAHEIQVIAAKFANQCPNTTTTTNQEHHHDDTKSTSDNTAASSTSNSNNTTNMLHECDGRVQVDHGDMDWTFLKELGSDYSSSSAHHYNHFGLYSDLDDKFHSGELLMYSTTTFSPPHHFEDQQIEDNHDDDPFSHQPFLWNW